MRCEMGMDVRWEWDEVGGNLDMGETYDDGVGGMVERFEEVFHVRGADGVIGGGHDDGVGC